MPDANTNGGECREAHQAWVLDRNRIGGPAEHRGPATYPVEETGKSQDQKKDVLKSIREETNHRQYQQSGGKRNGFASWIDEVYGHRDADGRSDHSQRQYH